jgi:endonuclease G
MASGKAVRAASFLRNAQTGGVQNAENVLESLATSTAPPVTGFESLRDEDKKAVEGALAKIDTPEAMEPQEEYALEAIIIPDRRPAVDIRNDDYRVDHVDWLHLNDAAARATILPRIPAIGRIEIPEHPSLPYAGTGFLVGDGLLMTNRHVAELLVRGLGRNGLSFRPGYTGEINFVEEAGRSGGVQYRIDEALLIHPYWDMAILRVRDVPREVQPLTLSRQAAAGDGPAPDVVVIGYPAFDPRNDIEVQRQVFGNLFNVKRLQPGKWLERRRVGSFGKQVEAITHDSSTLGGNSGSAVIDVASGRAVALHFGGRYLDANYGVPAGDLALDARLVDLGLNFGDGPAAAPTNGPWVRYWEQSEAYQGVAPGFAGPIPPTLAPTPLQGAVADSPASFQAGEWTIPITIRVGQPIAAASAAAGPAPTLAAPDSTPATVDFAGPRRAEAAGEAPTEKLVEPWHDEDYQSRAGYDSRFLGIEVPLPRPLEPETLATLDDGSHVVPYMHFSLAMHRTRRLALFTAANVRDDPALRNPDPTKKTTRRALSGLGENDQEKWFADPRLRGLDQLPDRFFNKDRKAFDKGHLVRRDDVAWGATYDELRIANGDSYHVTNCSPQTAGFNRADGVANWGELENAVLDQADDQRLSVFAGPVLRDDDPVFAGVDESGSIALKIPRAYWKVVAAREGDALAAYGFLLEQDLSGVDWERLAFEPKWQALARPLTDLEAAIGHLTFPEILHKADRFGTKGLNLVVAAAGLRDPELVELDAILRDIDREFAAVDLPEPVAEPAASADSGRTPTEADRLHAWAEEAVGREILSSRAELSTRWRDFTPKELGANQVVWVALAGRMIKRFNALTDLPPVTMSLVGRRDFHHKRLGSFVTAIADLALTAEAASEAAVRVSEPPMLRASWDLLVAASAKDPDVIVQKTPAAGMAHLVAPGSAWLVWDSGKSEARRNDAKMRVLRSYLQSLEQAASGPRTGDADDVLVVGAAVEGMAVDLDEEDLADLSRALGVPRATLSDMLERL